MNAPAGTLPASRRLAWNSLWNLTGIGVPMLAAIGLLPVLIERLGVDRFGLLALIWMGVGYFSLFDLGLGKALTHQVASRLASGDSRTLRPLVRTGLNTLFGLGLVAMLVVGLLTPWLVAAILPIPEPIQGEARWSFWILALSLPAVLTSAGLSGVLEGHQRFRLLALIRMPLGLSNFAVPAIIATFNASLVNITLALVVSRIVALSILFVAVWRELRFAGGTEASAESPRHDLAVLLSYGGWITVSSVVSPVLVYFDRFFISASLGLGAVAYYVTPYEVLSRMMILPQAMMAAIFPAMAQASAAQSPDVPKLAGAANLVMVLAMLPPTLGAALFAEELLMIWLGRAFAQESTSVVQFLAGGVLVNVLARVPLTALQSAGQANVTAKVHLLEVIPYLLFLWWAIGCFGIVGAAVAWLLRVSLDSLLLWSSAALCMPALRRQALLNVGLTFFIGPTVLMLSQVLDPQTKGVLWLATTAFCASILFKRIWPLLVLRPQVVPRV